MEAPELPVAHTATGWRRHCGNGARYPAAERGPRRMVRPMAVTDPTPPGIDFHQAWDWAVGVITTLLAWFLQQLHAKVDRIPETYARRDDVKDRFNDVMDTLARIESKLDSKADRH